MASSEISGFYKKSLEERIKLVKEFAKLSDQEAEELQKFAAMDFDTANRMIENVVGTQQLHSCIT